MDNIREILANATMAYSSMSIDVDGRKVVDSILDLLEENKAKIEKASRIDVKNNNGFKLNFEMINKIKNAINNLEDSYRKVISMSKNSNNYLQGKQTDNLGTICLIYDGNTYCLLEVILKAILTHNSIVVASKSDYMKATNELIVILVKRILEAYGIDKNLVQIIYTDRIEELLSNNVSINKVIVVGNKDLQEQTKKMSNIEVVCKGYRKFDIYIEDLKHLSFIKKIIKEKENIDIYVKSGIKVPFEDYIEVEDIDEAIAQINFNTSGYSSSIFTNDKSSATEFLREIKTDNISVNSSPLIEGIVDIDIEEFLMKKNMFYPNPMSEVSEKSKFEFPTQRAILEENKNNAKLEEMKKENQELKENNEESKKQAQIQLKQKDVEIQDLRRQLRESQNIANKYMNIFRKSFFSRVFGKLKKEDIEKDTKLLS